MDLDADYPEIREAVSRICAEFPSIYWRELDAESAYPTGLPKPSPRAISPP